MADARDVTTKYTSERPRGWRDAAVAELAKQQHGVVSLAQLRALGLSASAVRSRATAGRLHRVHRGVYAVGHPLLSGRGRWIAAVLACGAHAVLSHRSAAALWGIRPCARSAIEVTAPGRAGRRRAGIEVHDSATLQATDVTAIDRIPCTTVARTLLDLATVVDRCALARAHEQAEAIGLLDASAVAAVLERSAGRPGSAALHAVAEEARAPEFTRSELERRFLALCERAGLPRPSVNAWIALDGGGLEVDFAWERERLIVETDGHETHGTRSAFERDRVRDQRLVLAGWRVVRVTWRQIARDPGVVAAMVAALLGESAAKRRGWDSNPRGS